MFNKRYMLSIVIFVIVILIGFAKINIINTKALSPVGNGRDNYELVKNEFGEDFEEFLKDNSDIKIYPVNGQYNTTSIKIKDKEVLINVDNPITQTVYKTGSYIYSGINNIKNLIINISDKVIKITNNFKK